MKKTFLTLAIAAIFSFAFVACTPKTTEEDAMDTEPAEEQVDEMEAEEMMEPEVEEPVADATEVAE